MSEIGDISGTIALFIAIGALMIHFMPLDEEKCIYRTERTAGHHIAHCDYENATMMVNTNVSKSRYADMMDDCADAAWENGHEHLKVIEKDERTLTEYCVTGYKEGKREIDEVIDSYKVDVITQNTPNETHDGENQ